MRFELSVAARYLLPRKGHLSQSIISLISIGVISLVVWLILIFLSITDGLENNWINKLTAIAAPLRLTPKEAYFDSYYYQIDSYSDLSDYRSKSIREKKAATIINPFNPNLDGELPSELPSPHLNENGELKDLIKETIGAIKQLPFASETSPFEIASAEMHVHLVRDSSHGLEENFLSQLAYLTSLEEEASPFHTILVTPTLEDIDNWRQIAERSPDRKEILERLDANIVTTKTGVEGGVHFEERPSIEPLWSYCVGHTVYLPKGLSGSEPLMLAKGFQQSGLQLGDETTLSYFGTSFSGLHELKTSAFIAGFYDPGIMPLGGRIVMAKAPLVTSIRAASQSERWPQGSGLLVYLKDPKTAPEAKEALLTTLQSNGLDQYWTVESYEDYDFSKDLVGQLKSDKYLFTLIALIIILVACSNIVSMLILLVNDKTRDIGILRAMGASQTSIVMIFGLSGVFLGLLSSLIGTVAAYLTLYNLQSLINLLALLQGRNPFNSLFFGDSLPSLMSSEALMIVWIAALILSAVAGLVPALKASRIKPTETLKG